MSGHKRQKDHKHQNRSAHSNRTKSNSSAYSSQSNSTEGSNLSSQPTRRLPVRPNLDQLKHQAKDLLRDIRRGDPAAIQEFNAFHPKPISIDESRRMIAQEKSRARIDAGEPSASTVEVPAKVTLTDAQLALARSYEAPSWPRLVQCCKLIDAIWRNDVEAVRELVVKHPKLLHENAGIRNNNWGPPMSYAANLGRDQIIRVIFELGATDLEHAIDRATLQSKIATARMLHEMLGSPRPPDGSLSGPAYTLSVPGTALMFEFGAPVRDANGMRLAPVDVVLETDSRNPSAKHQILELYVQHGLELPDTPTMALHRGRLDLLADHLRRDPRLLQRTFMHEEIYPPELGCHDEVLATQGTPLAGTTLLHMCVDYDEIEIARWLLERGMDPDAKAAIDADGFGGHTPLFATVVSQPNFWMNHNEQPQVAPFTQLLLDHRWKGGADPNASASLRKQLHPGYGPKYDVDMHEYRDVTPLAWGKQFHAKVFVSEPAMRMIEERGGHE